MYACKRECVCVCVCVCELEGEMVTEKQRKLCVSVLEEGERKGERLEETVCVRACVCLCLLNIQMQDKLRLRNSL